MFVSLHLEPLNINPKGSIGELEATMAKTTLPLVAGTAPPAPSASADHDVAFMETMSSQNNSPNPEKTLGWKIQPWEYAIFIILAVVAVLVGGGLALILKPELRWLPW